MKLGSEREKIKFSWLRLDLPWFQIKLVMVKSTFFMHTNWISTIKNGGLTMTSLFLSHNKSNLKQENLLFTIKNGYLTMTNVTFNHGKMFF